MTITRLVKAAALVQLARSAVNRRRRSVRSRYRRQTAWAALGVAGAGVGLWLLWRYRDPTPAWVRKKERKEARRETARRERQKRPTRKAKVHVERQASPNLKVPLGEQIE